MASITLHSPSRRRVLAGLAGASTLVLAGCQTGNLNLNQIGAGVGSMFAGLSMGEKDELAMAKGLYPRLIDQSGGAYPNRGVQRAMRDFAAPLFATSKRAAFEWEVTVLDDDTPNAWAMPGGKLAVNKGLLRYVRNEDELAAVLAHEIGHAELSHGLAEMRQQRFTEGMTTIGREALSSQVGNNGLAGALTEEALNTLQGPMMAMISSGYSRSNESEADAHILAVFAKTGNDPHKASGLFKTLLEIIPESGSGTTSLFNSHPGTRDRIAALDALAAPLATPKTPTKADGWSTLKETFPTREHFRHTAKV